MKSIFEETNRQELIGRIHTVQKDSPSHWGKMTVTQMVKHCVIWEEWMQGVHQPTYRQEFLGYIFGKMALRKMIKDDKPFDKGIPTSRPFQVREKGGNLEDEKKNWIRLMQSYEHYSNPGFIHDFFGKMTREQIGILVYKHSDHHLRQFGC